MKNCSSCKTEKELSYFTSIKAKPGLFMSHCKACRARYEKDQRAKGLRADISRRSKEKRASLGILSTDYVHSRRFGGLRNAVLVRDGFSCVSCGMTQNDHVAKWQRSLTIDHIDGNGRYSDSPNNTLENLQTLCLPCHGKKDGSRQYPVEGS